MTRKSRRLYFVALGLFGLFAGTGLMLFAFQDNLNYFFSTTEMLTKKPSPGQQVYTGGLVEKGSVIKSGATVTFTVTDLTNSLPVRYTGLLPDLFKEGTGVLVEGHLGADGVFAASEVLAKHDENYMPKDVADALKKSGRWKEPTTTAKGMRQ